MTKTKAICEPNTLRDAALFIAGLCAASCIAWEAMGTLF
jgi:hypothetical protein